MMQTPRISAVAAGLAFVTVLGLAGAPPAQAGRWQETHPRRAEVNGRLLNQNARIDRERRTGQITASQAHSLHQQDHSIRQEERSMAAQHDSHITLGEQASLNQQENTVSHEIGR